MNIYEVRQALELLAIEWGEKGQTGKTLLKLDRKEKSLLYQLKVLDMLGRAAGSGWQCEWRFHKTRLWRFDYAHPGYGIGIEIQGGIFIKGKHSRGAGQLKDWEKYNAAQLMGWKVLQYSPQQLQIMVNDVRNYVDSRR